MLLSIQELAAIAATNRETVKKRADQLGLEPVDGEKGSKRYDSRSLLQLRPAPSRYGSGDGVTMNPEEARARKDAAQAEKTELEVARLKGELADVGELLEAQNSIFDEVAAVIKKSRLEDAEKEDLLSIIGSVPAKCWKMQPK